MKKLLVNGEGVDIYFSAETNRTDILLWIEEKLYEMKYNEFTTNNRRNIFNLNEPYSCSVFDCSSIISKKNNNFVIKGDEDYKIIDIKNIKPVF